MPNFDAWRSAIIGPLSYICKPQKPLELIGCYPLNGNVYDISRYGGNIGTTPTYYDSDWVLGTKRISGPSSNSVAVNLGKPLDLSKAWSFDYIQNKTVPGNNASLAWVFGPITWRQTSDYQNTTMTDGVNTISTSQSQNPPWFTTGNSHVAFRYDGNGHIDFFTSGILRYAYDFDLSSVQSINALVATYRNAYDQKIYWQNLRVVQKYLGTATTYPVPSTLYTGYEVL